MLYLWVGFESYEERVQFELVNHVQLCRWWSYDPVQHNRCAFEGWKGWTFLSSNCGKLALIWVNFLLLEKAEMAISSTLQCCDSIRHASANTQNSLSLMADHSIQCPKWVVLIYTDPPLMYVNFSWTSDHCLFHLLMMTIQTVKPALLVWFSGCR